MEKLNELNVLFGREKIKIMRRYCHKQCETMKTINRGNEINYPSIN